MEGWGQGEKGAIVGAIVLIKSPGLGIPWRVVRGCHVELVCIESGGAIASLGVVALRGHTLRENEGMAHCGPKIKQVLQKKSDGWKENNT